MAANVRTIDTYDVRADAAVRWPGWRFEQTKLYGLKYVICTEAMLVLVDPADFNGSAEEGWTFALAHLDLNHTEAFSPCFTEEHKSLARTVADIRLDRPRC